MINKFFVENLILVYLISQILGPSYNKICFYIPILIIFPNQMIDLFGVSVECM